MKNSRTEAIRLRDLVAAWRLAGRVETEAMLAVAVALHSIRKAHGADDVAFGTWLRSKRVEIAKNDRAALIHMGEHPVVSAEVLRRTKRRCPELIWRYEIAPRIGKPPEPEQPETFHLSDNRTDGTRPTQPAATPGADFTVSGTEQEAARAQAAAQQARLAAAFQTAKQAAAAAEEASERKRAQEQAASDAEAIEGVPELAAALRLALEPAVREHLFHVLALPDAIAALRLLLHDTEKAETTHDQLNPNLHPPAVADSCPAVGGL